MDKKWLWWQPPAFKNDKAVFEIEASNIDFEAIHGGLRAFIGKPLMLGEQKIGLVEEVKFVTRVFTNIQNVQFVCKLNNSYIEDILCLLSS